MHTEALLALIQRYGEAQKLAGHMEEIGTGNRSYHQQADQLLDEIEKLINLTGGAR